VVLLILFSLTVLVRWLSLSDWSSWQASGTQGAGGNK